MKIDKSGFKDVMGRALTQSLFLEHNYDTDFAYYTLDDEDKEYKGKTYPSLKKLYIASDDPIEYEFANTYLLGWAHWQKICGNKILLRHVEQWREELELKIASEGFRTILDQSENNVQATKWLIEKGWKKQGAGRPKKDSGQKALDDFIEKEFEGDVVRMDSYRT